MKILYISIITFTILLVSCTLNTENIDDFYIVDPNAYLIEEDIPTEEFAKEDLSSDLESGEPTVLVYHTHGSETYSDGGSIVDVGEYLCDILYIEYGIVAIHDTGLYDYNYKTNEVDTDGSYEKSAKVVEEYLEEYPTIEVVIDLHRDWIPEEIHLTTEIDGETYAQLMFVNGILVSNVNGQPVPIEDLENPYIYENMALSYQMQVYANEKYPGLMRNIYIKEYRYNLHLTPKSMLIEVGAQTNTTEEAMNSMEFLAEMIDAVLNKNRS